MKLKTSGLLIILAVILLIGGCGCSKYNTMVNEDENVKNAWNKVQSDYQRRADLIPNLVSTVKGEADFEKGTLTNVIQARASATQIKVNTDSLTPEKLLQFQAVQGQLSQALGRLMVVSEKYPELKSNESFRNLQKQLEGTENRIKFARNNFNDAVRSYNLTVRSFPNNLYAGATGFKQRVGFEADAQSQNAPKIQF